MASKPLWTEVYRALYAEIRTQRIPPGASLPTISALAAEYGLTRHGARRVLERLTAEGLAQGWQGRGFIAAMPRLRIRIHRGQPTFHGYIAENGRASGSDLISAKSAGLPRHLAAPMDRRPGAQVEITETLRRVDGHAVALSVDYFPSQSFPKIADTIAETGSISRALADHGVRRFTRNSTAIEARLPTAHEALVLGVPPQQPVLQTVGVNIEAGDQVIQVSTAIWRADCVTLEV